MLRDDYEADPVWQKITEVEDALDQFTDTAKADPMFSDLQKKIGYVRWVLEKSEPFLFSSAELDGINDHLDRIIHHIQDDADWAELENPFAEIYKAAPYPRIQKIFKTDANRFFEKCESEIAALKSDGVQKLEELTEQVDEKLTETTDQADATLAELTNKSDALDVSLQETKTWLEQVDEALTTSDTKIEAQFENWKTRLDTEITEKLKKLTTTFSDDQTARSKEHKKHLKEIQATRDTARTILKEIEDTYGVVGKIALSGELIQAAEREEKSYTAMSWLAIFTYVAIPSVFTYLWIYETDHTNTQLSDLLIRLPIAAIFFAPAIYFSTLAQRHRRVAVSMRSLGIRIATFDAYLINFSNSAKNAAKKQMLDVFFDTKISTDPVPMSPDKDMAKSLDQLLGPIERLMKLGGGKDGGA
ncbi:MAG: hypothetical protein V3V13_07655 [Paracoccaceae bacterium]